MLFETTGKFARIVTRWGNLKIREEQGRGTFSAYFLKRRNKRKEELKGIATDKVIAQMERAIKLVPNEGARERERERDARSSTTKSPHPPHS